MSAPGAKIGVLDSGVGGLTVLTELHRLLPNYPTLYFGDQGHLPYGPRPAREILAFVDGMTRFLCEQGVVVIVIACHAASAASLEPLRERYPNLPIVGIEPAIKPAIEATRTGVVGVLTTQATADGALYQRVLARYAGDTHVITQVAPELVLIAESGDYDSTYARDVMREYTAPMLAAGADQLVLACTHFPFLAPTLREIVGERMALVEPSGGVARQVARVLPQDSPPASDDSTYFTSGSASAFQAMMQKLTGITAPVTAMHWRGDHYERVADDVRERRSGG